MTASTTNLSNHLDYRVNLSRVHIAPAEKWLSFVAVMMIVSTPGHVAGFNGVLKGYEEDR